MKWSYDISSCFRILKQKWRSSPSSEFAHIIPYILRVPIITQSGSVIKWVPGPEPLFVQGRLTFQTHEYDPHPTPLNNGLIDRFYQFKLRDIIFYGNSGTESISNVFERFISHKEV